jgi:hypothetical protein
MRSVVRSTRPAPGTLYASGGCGSSMNDDDGTDDGMCGLWIGRRESGGWRRTDGEQTANSKKATERRPGATVPSRSKFHSHTEYWPRVLAA